MVSFMVFVFGLAAGSFLHSVAWRMEQEHTALRGRSYCASCKHTLSWQDLIPLVSFLILAGRCRYCKARISFEHPLSELAMGIVFLLVFWRIAPEDPRGVLSVLYAWAMAAFFMVIFFYDLRNYLIPDKILYPAILVSGIWYFASGAFSLHILASALGAAAFFFTIYALSKGKWMGFGDVKLAFLLGLFLGWPSILVALFSAFCLGAVAGLVLVVCKKKGLRSEVPFAPFLIAGTAIAFFFGPNIVSWYLGLFLV